MSVTEIQFVIPFVTLFATLFATVILVTAIGDTAAHRRQWHLAVGPATSLEEEATTEIVILVWEQLAGQMIANETELAREEIQCGIE